MSKEKSCGALVCRQKNGRIQILVLKHRLGGHWSFPKGHVEQHETEVETALREVKEETGLTIQLVGDFREQVSYSPRPGVDKDVVYFLGFAQNSCIRRQEEEVSEIRWVDLDRSYEYLTFDNDRLLVNSARRYIQEHPAASVELSL